MHGSGEFAYALAERGLIDEYEVYLNPLVWGEGDVHVLGDRAASRPLAKRTRAGRGRSAVEVEVSDRPSWRTTRTFP
jgi:dihydrofolate reductase